MSNPTIFIFGDSYSADYSSGDSWVDLLEHELKFDYNIENISTKGIGPYTLIDKLSSITYRVKKDDILIFVFPDVMRYNLGFIENEEDQVLASVLPHHTPKHQSYVTSKIGKENLKFIFDLHKYLTFHQKNRGNEVMKLVSWLSVIGQKHFKKTLIVPTARFVKSVDLNLFKDIDGFTVVDFFLENVSENEGAWEKTMLGTHGQDLRVNHLNENNLKVLKDQVIEWINNDVTPTENKFNQ